MLGTQKHPTLRQFLLLSRNSSSFSFSSYYHRTKEGGVMPKFSRRFAVKLAGGLFAFIPAVKYLADATPALADGNLSPSYELPGCSGGCITAGSPFCDDPNQTGTKTL